MSIDIIMDAVILGMIFAIMSFGVFISFRVLNIPDLTIDGSFTTGCAASVVFCVAGHPWIGLMMAFVCGGLAGVVTGFLQTKGKIQPLLAGILTMTALYSINLKIMSGKPIISTFGLTTIYTAFEGFGPYYKGILILLILVILVVLLYAFLKTQLGMSLRATGDNEAMVRASSINSDSMKVMGIALANAIVALGGGIFAQYQNFSDVTSGIGMMVVGLASIIVGEAFFRKKTLLFHFLAVIIGAIVYRFILTIALKLGIASTDMKLVSAILVALAISLPQLMKRRKYHA
ncbi:ABC transporter permease [[Eubacterium] hominis]|uniref:ABC transporter permease n=1 Tax=[Eubacterium] hominis TaxID=2764325 RepID=UPI003A4DBB3F